MKARTAVKVLLRQLAPDLREDQFRRACKALRRKNRKVQRVFDRMASAGRIRAGELVDTRFRPVCGVGKCTRRVHPDMKCNTCKAPICVRHQRLLAAILSDWVRDYSEGIFCPDHYEEAARKAGQVVVGLAV